MKEKIRLFSKNKYRDKYKFWKSNKGKKYFTSFYSSAIKQVEEYDYTTEYLHIDISFGMGSSEPIKKEYILKSKEYEDTYIDNFRIMVYNMDKLKEVWYHEGGKRIERYKHLLMLDLDKKDSKLSKKDKLINDYKRKIMRKNEGYDYIALSAGNDAIMLDNTYKQYYI